MKINLFNHQDTFKVPSPLIRKAVKALLSYKNASCDEVSFYFVSPEEIGSLHETYFQDPSETDCITFPIDDPFTSSHHPLILGDVFVCPAVAHKFAHSHNTSYTHELLLYVIHGLLHLLGYDDISPEDYKLMKQEEKNCMQFLVDTKVIKNEPFYLNNLED